MAETRHRAEVTSRSRPDQSWDAGLHAESDQGPIDVGVSIESSALGLVVEAPGLGVLRLSFDVAPDGAAKLATASRTLDDGRKVAVIAVDETKVLQLQAANSRLDEQVALVVSERDEARHRAAALMEEKRAIEGHLETLEADHGVERERLTTTLQIERDQRLVALGEREKARAELERLRGELDAGSATLMREVNEARAARDASEAERGRVSRELTELSEQLQARAADVDSLQRAKKELEAGVQALEAQLTLTRSQHQAAENASTEQSSALEASQAEVTNLTHQLEVVRAQLADGTSQLEATSAQAQHAQAQVASLTEELERASAQLADGASQLESTGAEAQSTRAQVTSLSEELEQLRAQLEAATAQVSQLEAEREQVRDQLSAKTDELALTSQALDDLQRDQARASAELQALRADFELQVARAQAETQDAREAQALAEGRIATLEAAALESGTQLAELTTLQQTLAEVQSELDVVRAQAAAHHAELQAQLDDAVSAAKEWDAALKSERTATSEAREVAKQLKAQFDKAAHERDEARAIARQLHQKVASASKSPEDEANQKTLLIERDSLSMQVEALCRQLEQERTARARAVTERDEFRSRFKALTSSTPARSPEDSQETTRPYHIDALDLNPTQRDMPSLRSQDVKTEPARGQVAPPKKKGP